MSKEKKPPETSEQVIAEILSTEEIISRVHEGFSPKNRAQISREDIQTVLKKLNLFEHRPDLQVPRLMVQRLRFKGLKTLAGQEPQPIDYEQKFASGVNVILIEDNLVGKSTILKTIKFALTGDDGEYDPVVRSWITDIWLEFSLDDKVHTVLLSRQSDGLYGMLIPDRETQMFKQVTRKAVQRGLTSKGYQDIQQMLGQFFFQKYALSALGWTQTQQTADGQGRASECKASWLTYFKALRIRDDDHTYLLCEPLPGLAQQETILFSAFLGLHLVEPLNQLQNESSLIKKKQAISEKEIAELEGRKEQLKLERSGHLKRIKEINDKIQVRQKSVVSGDLEQRLQSTNEAWRQKEEETNDFRKAVLEMAMELRQDRARVRQAREHIELRHEFSGLEVSLCPNCTKAVDPDAIKREQDVHTCRLCSKQADPASPQEVVQLGLQLRAYEAKANDSQREHESAKKKLETLKKEESILRTERANLWQSSRQGVSFGYPTEEERNELDNLNQQIGRLDNQVWLIDEKIKNSSTNSSVGNEQKILDKVRSVIKVFAEQRNHIIQQRLSELTQDVVRAIGAEAITNISCSALGRISFSKGDISVTFSGIKNPGERFRVKLAVFLAMMQLGRAPGLGRHPGFLLIDQLAASEMVPAHTEAAARVLRQVEESFHEHVQIICCTAGPAFRNATTPEKIYGPKVVGTNGKKYAY